MFLMYYFETLRGKFARGQPEMTPLRMPTYNRCVKKSSSQIFLSLFPHPLIERNPVACLSHPNSP